jgi:hypothetical protein
VNNYINAIANHIELRVGHENCDFDEGIGREIEPGHLAINPNEVGQHSGHGLKGRGYERAGDNLRIRSPSVHIQDFFFTRVG